MNLADIKTEGNCKVLITGMPGAGKTCLAASFPGPILYLDFDNKVDSAALFYRGKPELLAGVEVRQFGNYMKIDPMHEFISIVDKELVPQQTTGKMKYATIVLDSISAFSTATLNHIIATNPGIKGRETAQGRMPDKPHYGILLRKFLELIPGLISLPCNIVMLAHLETYKDEATGTIIRGPAMDGSFDQKLPQFFKESWFLYVDDKGKRWIQTRADSRFGALCSRIPGLPNLLCVDNGYAEIAKYL